MHAVPRAVQDSLSSPSAGFTAAHRLLRKDGYDRVLQAQNLADKHFKIFFARNSNSNARLGIIASKRTLPHATDRNRVKRIVREAFRQHHLKTRSIDLVVMVRRVDALDKLGNDLGTLFNRIEGRCAEL